MKILLIGNYPPDGQKSMAAFSALLARELPRLGCEVRLLCPPARVMRWPLPNKARKWAGYIDKFVLFPFALRRHAQWADVVHVCDHSNAMYIPHLRQRPNMLTCHDVIAIQAARGIVRDWSVGFTGRVFQKLIAQGIGQTDLVACISRLSQHDLLALELAPATRVIDISHALNEEFAPLPAKTLHDSLSTLGIGPEEAYLLHVGDEHPRKNRMAVLQAFIEIQRHAAAAAIPPVVRKLVFVGPELSSEMQAFIHDHESLAIQVMVLRDVSHAQLRALYGGATALLFPSLREGFGWPIIEAQACGCPVFTSNLAPMNEIGSEAAVYIDPHDPAGIAATIAQTAPCFSRMRLLGLENARRFCPRQMAQRYIDAYHKVIQARQVPIHKVSGISTR